MQFVNLTPHAIVVYLPDGSTREIPASGQIARLVDPKGPQTVPSIGDLPAALYSPLEGRRLEGLPLPKTGTVYLTSILCLPVAQAQGRLDVAAPDTDTGAVRVSKGQPNAGTLLGTTRLLYAGDEPPAYRLITGSVTHRAEECAECDGGRNAPCLTCGSGESRGWVPPTGGQWTAPRDLDVLGWGDAEVGEENRVAVSAGPARMGLPLDYHEIAPFLGRDGSWEIRVPVWGEEDPSQPQLLWHSPCARPVRVVRDVLRTGPAQLRRYAATGVMPDFGPQSDLPDHGDSGHLVVELSTTGDAPGYRGCGLSAWRRAAERFLPEQMGALPDHVQEFLYALLEADLETVALNAASPRTEEQKTLKNLGTPAAGPAITYAWYPPGYWMPVYGHGSGYVYLNFADALKPWAAE